MYHSIDFPHTHRILYLLELCPGKDDWADTLTDAEELTPYAVTTRYPGEDEPVTKTEAWRAISIATLVHTTILEALAWKDKGFRE